MELIVDIAPFTYRSGTDIRSVLERFNAAARQIGCIVAEDGALIGTVTDGDIRRGMLAGAVLEDPIDRCMNATPFVLKEGEHPQPGASRREFLPVVDASGRLLSIFVETLPTANLGPCLVMAGGFGSRMGDATRHTPKPLLELNGRPILDHILERVEAAGHKSIYISTYYLSDKIEGFIESRSNSADVHIVNEAKKLGTAGAVGLLADAGDAPLTMLNGDVVTNIDLKAFRDYHDRHALDATIAVARYEHEIPYGVVRQSPEGLFTGIEEKPTVRHFVSAGIYCLSADVRSLVPKDVPMDMPELLNEARSLGMKVGLFPIHEYWRDVGRPSDLSRARDDMMSAPK
ncbi:MAG: sugar phosphate nucleotidyltransferase [Alphaproteobacteria bacterium]|nr:sugar phosphate nucleotidyltransferase [Alphaproteobacteria bacterium]